MTPMKLRKARIPTGLRRTLAAVAITAVAMAGWHLNASTPSGIGVLGLPGATAEPTGPPGPTGPGGMNGGQFQPPGLPPQMPDYQGGNNQPPLDQNNGISIYNTGAQGAPQQPGQQGAQQGDPGQQPQHGTQIPDYQTATPYTQGPGKANPDYQAPQQGNQGQQPQQGQQQQPSQAPTQTQQPSQQDQQDQQIQRQCEQQAQYLGVLQQFLSFAMSAAGGAGSVFQQPSRKFAPVGQCCITDEQAGPEEADSSSKQNPPRSNQDINCEAPKQAAEFDDLDFTIPNKNINIGGDPKPNSGGPRLNETGNPLSSSDAENPLNTKVPKGTRPIPTGTALGPQGRQYAFYSTPKVDQPPDNYNYVTPNSLIVDLANKSTIIGNSPLAQSSGAYDPVSNTMLIAGNVSADRFDMRRALFQSDPIDPKNPNSWIGSLKKIGDLMPGSRESQLITLGPEGRDGFLFVGSTDGRPVTYVIASTPEELTKKLVGRELVKQDINNIDGVDMAYGPTVVSQNIDPATGAGNIRLRVSQFWDPKVPPPADPNLGRPYAPRIYEAGCSVQ